FPPFPYTTLFRSRVCEPAVAGSDAGRADPLSGDGAHPARRPLGRPVPALVHPPGANRPVWAAVVRDRAVCRAVRRRADRAAFQRIRAARLRDREQSQRGALRRVEGAADEDGVVRAVWVDRRAVRAAARRAPGDRPRQRGRGIRAGHHYDGAARRSEHLRRNGHHDRRRVVDSGGAQSAEWHVAGALFGQHTDERRGRAADRVGPAAEPASGRATDVVATRGEEAAATGGRWTRGGGIATNRRSKTHRSFVKLAAQAAQLKEEVAWVRRKF